MSDRPNITWRLPDEIWIHIFQFLADPADILQVYRTCRLFKAVSLEPLFTHLKWLDTSHTQDCLQTLDKNPMLRRLPVSVTFGLTHYDPETDLLRRFSNHDEASNVSELFDNYDSGPLYMPVLNWLATFPALRALYFEHASLLDSVYSGIIGQLHQLDTLSIVNCSVALMPGVNVLSHLGITSYTFRRNRIHRFSLDNVPNGVTPLVLVASPRLKSISIEWMDTHMGAMNLPIASARQPHLTHVELVLADRGEPGSTDLRNLPSWLANRPSITHLRILPAEKSDKTQHFIESVRMRSLQVYDGPMTLCSPLVFGSEVLEHVRILEQCKLASVLYMLESLPRSVRSLAFACTEWDTEIVYAITELLPNLEKLEFRYARGRPADNFMVSMGPDLLPRTPKLHTLHMFPVNAEIRKKSWPDVGRNMAEIFECSTKEDEEDDQPVELLESRVFSNSEVRGFLQAWNRYCPNLRAVKLTPTASWERDSETQPWMRYNVQDSLSCPFAYPWD
ncbi:hypothetical protein FISHEDRAFT_71097 [Fistulina hepatica ATCC 64428]|nr:hypothetical protein FISHEDRAFT_71097 [Fistulina hepatica ATCC 64428]